MGTRHRRCTTELVIKPENASLNEATNMYIDIRMPECIGKCPSIWTMSQVLDVGSTITKLTERSNHSYELRGTATEIPNRPLLKKIINYSSAAIANYCWWLNVVPTTTRKVGSTTFTWERFSAEARPPGRGSGGVHTQLIIERPALESQPC